MIRFRSRQHYVYGCIWIGSFVLWLLGVVCDELLELLHARVMFPAWALSLVVVSGMAIVKTDWGKKNDHVWSRDCIWFNALMAALYLGVYAAARWIA